MEVRGHGTLVRSDVGRGTTGPPVPRYAPKAGSHSDWDAFVEGHKAKSSHYWLSLVQDLARNGLPCDDCIDRAARELGRYLVHVQGVDPDKAADLVCRWAEDKSNGFISRLGNGRAGDVWGQIRRIVHHVAGEEDFGGRLVRMRRKLVAGEYRKPIDLPGLMAAPSGREASRPSEGSGGERRRVILIDKNRSIEVDGAAWERVHEKDDSLPTPRPPASAGMVADRPQHRVLSRRRRG